MLMSNKMLKIALRLSVAVLGTYSLLSGYGNSYFIFVGLYYCNLFPQTSIWCRWDITTSNGAVAEDGGAPCNAQTGRSDGSVYAGAQAYNYDCSVQYTIIADAYATPGNEPLYYAVSAGGYSSGCSPNLYIQDSCDAQYNADIGGCTAPCG